MAVRRMPWLPQAPEDLRRRSEAIDCMNGGRGKALRQLASHELNNNQLLRLARSLNLARAAGAEAPLSQAPDAEYLDSSGLSAEQVEEAILRLVRQRTSN